MRHSLTVIYQSMKKFHYFTNMCNIILVNSNLKKLGINRKYSLLECMHTYLITRREREDLTHTLWTLATTKHWEPSNESQNERTVGNLDNTYHT